MLGEELKLWNSPQRWKWRRGEKGVDASAAIGTHFPATYLGLHLEPHQSNTPSCNTQWQVSTCPPTLSITTTRCRYCGEVGLATRYSPWPPSCFLFFLSSLHFLERIFSLGQPAASPFSLTRWSTLCLTPASWGNISCRTCGILDGWCIWRKT